MIREALARASTALLARRARPLGVEELGRDAVVFSPHFDDETLGCGGTVLRKRALGAEIDIVFLTDGRASHRDWISEAELARTRAEEGLAAAGALGVAAERVHRLGFEETRLAEHAEAAQARVREIVLAREPAQVFVPYRCEAPADHAGTFEIVSRALAEYSRPVVVFEYPIWAWVQWPWAARPVGSPRLLVRELRLLARFLRDFRVRVDISALHAGKRRALEQHRSQLFRPEGRSDWPVLADVAGGDFLASFFRDFEVFARSSSEPGAER